MSSLAPPPVTTQPTTPRTTQPTPKRIMVAAAHRLASLGVPVHWLYGPHDPRPKKADGSFANERLDRRGKTPVGQGWQMRPYTSPTDLVAAYEDGFNLGIHTGRVSETDLNLFAIDLDNDRALEWALAGGIPETSLITRSSKGQHWFYRVAADFPKIDNSIHKLHADVGFEIDIIADGKENGHNIVCAPSTHWTGFRYEEVEPWNRQLIEECPFVSDWFLKLIEPIKKTVVAFPVGVGLTGSTDHAPPIGSTDPTTLFRAQRYAEKFAPAIDGQGGSQTCFRLAQALVCGFCITPDEAFTIMRGAWNAKCCHVDGSPSPWSDSDLIHKIQDASRGERLPGPRGWLLEKKTGSLALAQLAPGEVIATAPPTVTTENISPTALTITNPAPAPTDIRFATLKKRLTPHIPKLIHKGLLRDTTCQEVVTRRADGSKIGYTGILETEIPKPAMYVCDDLAEQFLMGGLLCGAGYILTARISDAVALGCGWDTNSENTPGVIAGAWQDLFPLLSRLKPGAKITLVDPPAVAPALLEQHRIRSMPSPAAALVQGEDLVKLYEAASAMEAESDAESIPASLPERKPWECNDEGNGKRLVGYFGNEIMYCAELGKWFIWDGKRWKPDQIGQIHTLSKRVRKLIQLREVDFAKRNGDSELATALEGWYQKTGSHERRVAMIKDAQTEATVSVRAEQLDSDRWLLNCANGLLDLRTGELKTHERSAKQTKLVGTIYDPSAQCPTWEAALLKWMRNDVDMVNYLQRVCGWLLTGDMRDAAFFVLYGEGSNGKSTFVNVLLDILQDYAQTGPTSLIMNTGAEAEQSPGALAAIARLKGYRLVLVTETDASGVLGEAQIKRLTSKEPISAKLMGQNFFEFTPTHKIVLQTNHRPKIRSSDHGIWRRPKMIEFGYKFTGAEKDPGFEAKLIRERAGILAWMVRGCLEWQDRGLDDPEKVSAAVEEYRAEMDPLSDFIEDCAEKTEEARGGFVSNEQLCNVYRAWYRLNKGIVCSDKQLENFLRHLERSGKFVKGRTARARGWKGLRLWEGSAAYQAAQREG